MLTDKLIATGRPPSMALRNPHQLPREYPGTGTATHVLNSIRKPGVDEAHDFRGHALGCWGVARVEGRGVNEAERDRWGARFGLDVEGGDAQLGRRRGAGLDELGQVGHPVLGGAGRDLARVREQAEEGRLACGG